MDRMKRVRWGLILLGALLLVVLVGRRPVYYVWRYACCVADMRYWNYNVQLSDIQHLGPAGFPSSAVVLRQKRAAGMGGTTAMKLRLDKRDVDVLIAYVRSYARKNGLPFKTSRTDKLGIHDEGPPWFTPSFVREFVAMVAESTDYVDSNECGYGMRVLIDTSRPKYAVAYVWDWER